MTHVNGALPIPPPDPDLADNCETNPQACDLDPATIDVIDATEASRVHAHVWCNTHARFRWAWLPRN